MPKKTKREKILAEYRRKMRQLQTEKVGNAETNIANITTTKPKEEDQNNLKYFFQDLKKSLIFITFIILFEVILYFVKI